MSALNDFFAILPPVPGTGTVYDKYRTCNEAGQLEAALQILKPRFCELTELSIDLSKTTQLPNKWEKALTESLGLAELQVLGCLGMIGFPASAGATITPLFEGTINLNGGCLDSPRCEIAFDVKPAYGSGEEIVRAMVEDEIEAWALQRGQPVPDCVFHISGPVTQGNPSGVAAQVQTALANLSPGPTYPHSFSITIGTSIVCVDLVQPQSLQVHTFTFSLADKNAAVKAALQGHLLKKSKNACPLKKPFLLLYVKPNGRGQADLKQSQVENFTHPDVTRPQRASQSEPSISGSDLWLGSLFFDYCQGTNGRPKRQGWFRESASWPTGVTGATLIDQLNLDQSSRTA